MWSSYIHLHSIQHYYCYYSCCALFFFEVKMSSTRIVCLCSTMGRFGLRASWVASACGLFDGPAACEHMFWTVCPIKETCSEAIWSRARSMGPHMLGPVVVNKTDLLRRGSG
jgi:hypothetical protein